MGSTVGGAAGVAFATAAGPVATNFAIFAQIYTALFSPFQAAVHGVSSSLAGQMGTVISALVLVTSMVFLIASAFRMEDGSVFSKLITQVLAPAAVVKVVLAGYDRWVVQPAAGFAPQIGNMIVGNLGGVPVTGGAPFDTVWNHAYLAGGAVLNAIPSGFSNIGPQIGMYIAVVFYWVIAAGAVGLSFVLFLISQLGLFLLLAIGPIFVLFGAAQYTRFLLKGYVSALASVICAQVIVLALLAIAIQVEGTIITPLMNAAPNANIWGMLSSLLIVGMLLMSCTVLAFKASAFAVGICGGVFDGIAPWVSAGVGLVRGTVGAVQQASTWIGTATRPVQVPARAIRP